MFGLVLNILVLSVISSYRTMHTRLTNTFIANLAALDAVVSIFLVLTTIFEYEQTYPLSAGHLADELLCRIWYTKLPLWGFLMSSTYGILALTFERYIGVVFPIWHRTSFTARKVEFKVRIEEAFISAHAFIMPYCCLWLGLSYI